MAKIIKTSFNEIMKSSDGPFWDRFREVDECIGFSEMIDRILKAPAEEKEKVCEAVKVEMDVKYKKFVESA